MRDEWLNIHWFRSLRHAPQVADFCTPLHRFMDLPGIVIADEPDLFWRRVSEHLAGSLVGENRSPETMAGLLWSECLRPMVRAGEDAVRRAQQA